MKKLLISVLVGMLSGSVVIAGMQSKGASAASAASTITFAPREGQLVVKNIYSSGSSTVGQVKFYSKNHAAYAMTASCTSGATVVSIANTGTAIASNDTVVVVYADGAAPTFATVSAATTTNITLDTAVAQACTTADKVYEVAASSVLNGATTFNPYPGNIYATPADSPLVIQNSGTTNSSILATVEW